MTFAAYKDGRWVSSQPSVLSTFGNEEDQFLEHWPRAGSMRGGKSSRREVSHPVPKNSDRLWPTPAASLPNDGEQPAQWLERFVLHASKEGGATRAGVPLAVAARAPVVLRVAKIGRIAEARALLERHRLDSVSELSSTDSLNPTWVELLMGFPEGWTKL